MKSQIQELSRKSLFHIKLNLVNIHFMTFWVIKRYCVSGPISFFKYASAFRLWLYYIRMMKITKFTADNITSVPVLLPSQNFLQNFYFSFRLFYNLNTVKLHTHTEGYQSHNF
jgi:hypothetical protein